MDMTKKITIALMLLAALMPFGSVKAESTLFQIPLDFVYLFSQHLKE